ncbi:MAG: hypothetical protein FWC60_01235 [Firmicutes bacterium]|nr:hypothetical protein [Bacillota bacterium]
MSKKGTIFRGLRASLEKNKRYGESKEADKKAAREDAKGTGNYVQPTGIRSGQTLKTYAKQTAAFSEWAAKNTTAKNMEQAEKFVGQYLQGMIDGTIPTQYQKPFSPWSIHTAASALGSAYSRSKNDFGVSLPMRSRDVITRSRNGNGSRAAERFTAEKYERVRRFVKATGARREGVINLTRADIREWNGTMEVHFREKNGLQRWSRVVAGEEDFVRAFFVDSPCTFGKTKDRVFDRRDLPSELHSCRHTYAKRMYSQLFNKNQSGDLLHCRGSCGGITFDKGVLMAVSEQMGHHRYDIVVGYLISDTE